MRLPSGAGTQRCLDSKIEECLSDRAIPELFRRIPRSRPPSFPQTRTGQGLEPEGRAGLGLGLGFPPEGGAAARRPAPPPGAGPRQMLQLFLILSRGVPQDPPNPDLPALPR